MVDDYLAESVGGTAAFLERIVGGVQAATFVGLSIASMLPFPITGIAADLGASALEGQVSDGLLRLRRIMGAVALGALTAVVAKVGFSAMKASIRYVQKFGLRGAVGNLWNSTVGLARRAWRKVQKLVGRRRCGCFVASTLVWTSAGAVPIGDIEAGTPVLAASDAGLVTDVTEIKVGKKIIVGVASLVHLTIRHQDGEIETIHTTDEHPFHVATTAQ